MGLFNKFKKKEEKACCCSCGNSTVVEEGNDDMCCGEKVNGICCIKVLGAGCKSCHEQFENVKEAVENMGLGIKTEYITDMEKVMSYGVTSMPAIVINQKVAVMGKVLKTKEVEELLSRY